MVIRHYKEQAKRRFLGACSLGTRENYLLFEVEESHGYSHVIYSYSWTIVTPVVNWANDSTLRVYSTLQTTRHRAPRLRSSMIYPRSQQSQERGLWTPNSVFTASPQKKKTKNKKTRHTNTSTHTHKPGQGRSPQPSFSHLFGTRTGRFQNKSPILRDLHIPP